MRPYVPKYTPPEQAAQERARRRAMLFWTAVAIPLLFGLLLFGYSDQAPAGLRESLIALDRSLGFPIAWLIGTIGPN